MKRFILTILILGIIGAAGYYLKQKYYDPIYLPTDVKELAVQPANNDELKVGDIIFQTSGSDQAKVIQLATHSAYNHCGIIFKNKKDYYVYESAESVKMTAFKDWIARGQDGHFVVKRLRNADQVLTPSVLEKLKLAGDRFKNKLNDSYLEWSDEKLYSSELVWKIYKEATGLSVGKPEQLRDFDLTSEPVRQLMQARYGEKIPLDESVISPVSIYNSELLTIVKSN